MSIKAFDTVSVNNYAVNDSRSESTMFDFLKYRLFCAIFSLLILGSFIGLCSYRIATRGYAFSYSVDFTGGTEVLLRFSKPTTDNQIKEILEKNGWHNPVMRDFPSNEVLIRLKQVSTDTKGFSEGIQASLSQAMPDNTIEILRVDSVSGSIGKVLRWKSIYAVGLALLLMLMYIWFRFWSVSFGVGAVIALFHDAIAILFVFLILDKEISINVISAILAVLGYSINDTIVIFTKIRQNIKHMKNASLEKIVNISLNQTLRRTILTSFATTLVVLSLMILGGEALKDLSLALFIGMIFGTYSSIYIASPIMLTLYKEGGK